MKYILTTIILLLGYFAQAQQSHPTLNVIGSSELSASPTMTIVSLSIDSKESAYDQSVKNLIRRIDLLTDDLKSIGFSEDQIITSTFSVSENYEYINNSRVKDGFHASQTIKVSFKQDKKRLLEVLNKAVSSSANATIFLSFDIDNERKDRLKKELIKLAVKDAKIKGEIIANESGFKIIGIKEINYTIGYGSYNDFIPITMQPSVADQLDIKISNFESENLTFRDQVQITFIIEKK